MDNETKNKAIKYNSLLEVFLTKDATDPMSQIRMSANHFAETGVISGSFKIALCAMLEESDNYEIHWEFDYWTEKKEGLAAIKGVDNFLNEFEAIGHYSCGELVKVEDVESKSEYNGNGNNLPAKIKEI